MAKSLLGLHHFGRWEPFAVHEDRFDVFLEEAEEPGDGQTGRQWFTIAPHDILEDSLADSGAEAPLEYNGSQYLNIAFSEYL